MALAFAVGVGGARLASPPPALLAILAVAGLVGWMPARASLRTAGRGGPAALVLVGLWCLTGGLVERVHHQAFLDSPLLAARSAGLLPSGSVFPLRGWVREEPRARGERFHFVLQVEEVRVQGRWRSLSGRVRVSGRDPAGNLRLQYGDRLELPLRLRAPRRFRNPGGFDYGRYLEGEGIHLLGSLKNPRLVRERRERRGVPGVRPLYRLRRIMLGRLERALAGPGQDETRRFLEAILLGERTDEEGRFETVLRRTGVYHIVSISGLHLVLLLGGVSRIARRLPGSRWTEPAGRAGAAFLYVLLSGGDDPILRSALATGWIGAGRWTGRRVAAGDSQALSMILLLAFRPLHLFHPGFQLSFLVTFGLLSGGPPWWPRLRALPVVGKGLAGSVSAWMVSTPLMAARFFQASPIALGMNLLAAPFLALALGAALLLMLFPVPLLGAGMHRVTTLFGGLGTVLLRIPGSFLRVPSPATPWILLLATAAMARLALGPVGRPEGGRRLGAAILLGLAGTAGAPVAPFPSPRFEVIALDVGQGDSILLRLPQGRAILVDAGGFGGTDFDVGERVVVPALLRLGVRHLDLMVLSHAHQDHGGGLPAVLEAFPPEELWMGESAIRSLLTSRILAAAARAGVPVVHPARGERRRLGNVLIEVLHPPPGPARPDSATNDDSLVLLIRGRGTTILLTGDIESEGERELIRSGRLFPVDLLKVPHHGSRTSAGEAFLAAVAPRLGVLSVGEENPWGFPDPEVLRRLARTGTRVYRTDRDGAIRVRWDGRRWRARAFPDP